MREKDEWRFSRLQAKIKLTKIHEVETHADTVPPPREKYESNFQTRGK